MEARDRQLDFAGEVRFPLPGSQSTTEFTKLLVETIFELKLSVERANASQVSIPLNFFKYHTNDGRSVPCITGLNNSFSLSWRSPVAGSREGFSLEATMERRAAFARLRRLREAPPGNVPGPASGLLGRRWLRLDGRRRRRRVLGPGVGGGFDGLVSRQRALDGRGVSGSMGDMGLEV